jgi:indole-3-glycerol phosphate synthase / phosphoribosylanthranilate isomerase
MALEAILAHKREELARRMAGTSIETLLAHCEPSRRDFAAALRGGKPGFVLEIKFASPSAGSLRSGGDLEPVLASYGRHADAVSVLTDEKFFGGSLARLAEVRARLVQPLLCKDFILDPYQVAEARLHGADAILLILSAVNDVTWRACSRLAERLGMAVLTEVHDEEETDRAVALGARLIGINHRDLRTLRMDPTATPRLAPRIPADRLVVAESGITSHDDVRRLRPHADAMLVGTALMRAADLGAAVHRLIYGITKVCGLTSAEDALAAREAGATHGGVVFAEGSPRRVTLEQAAAVRGGTRLAWVAVFADQSPEEVAVAAERLELHAVQLHGNESPETVARVRALVPAAAEVWKAIRVHDRLPLRAETGADRLLLDGSPPEVEERESRRSMAAPAGAGFGGTGHRFNWGILDWYPERADVMLAGGLRAENVALAAGLGVYGLDVSSGVEAAPGRKDPARLRAFFAARRRLPGRGGDPR